ncbi:hypothetical protein [Thiorhodovibrio frisius]|uniref:Uncharacterized protein n=1 Tax=Thiorhodovibrio frisius TaxID=631362 RepID=H8Z278_9GAMM|nr:hypothetical protein [Thiorhodovibrio frisius]EIC22640.1 hypothetical protein Thi970DRAFT_02918 [Thiorhodovibrio frisius]WPL22396.1 hypothetical protein Thiofri_02560 [Thiorhodovibrio frisius]
MIARLKRRFAPSDRCGTGMADAPFPARRRKRFSLSGTIGFERRIATDQQRIANQVLALMPPDEFRALLLCGAYGRGEGVRLRGHDGKEIADCYEYAVILGRSDQPLRTAVANTLNQLASALTATTGVAIRFRLFREEQLHLKPLSFPQADLRWSGRLLRGDARVIERMTDQPFEHLAPGAWLWQLVEEGQGLLRNQEWLRLGTHLDGDNQQQFFRHLIASVLICGDLRLALVGRYHPAHAEKLARLEALDQRHHRKFMTLYELAHRAYGDTDIRAFSAGHPLDWQARVAWLWLDALRRFEHWRSGRVLPSWESYCQPHLGKGQGWGTSLAERLSANLAAFGPQGLKAHPLWSLRHPRERLIGAMPLLLGGPQTAPEPAVAAALSLPAGTSWPRTVETFLHSYEHCRD